ncbi:alginate lyase family protein [Paenibacillus luteus]|uniref:alginate lyase family protein n=1 Tax=Paenibacillus luteus TaxID=2545753 RepID=UPI001144D4FB|nr:alginate lyase family protein [Paenibacillus luteus]
MPGTLEYRHVRHDPRYTQELMPDDYFLAQELRLERPGMEEVAERIEQRDVMGARDAYLRNIRFGVEKRYYYGFDDISTLFEVARTHYQHDEEARRAIEEADRITEGDIPLYKERRASFEGGVYDWNSSLHDSSQYQLHLVRFSYVKYLVRAYGLTGDEKYAQCFNEMMDHFFSDNPMPMDSTFRWHICTWDPLSTGIRMFTLAEPFVVFFDSPAFLPEVKLKMIKAFQQHGRYVRQYLAASGNHVCTQLRGLVQIALLLPELKESEEWLNLALEQLPGSTLGNLYEDGVQFEASPSYHVVVMRDLYELVPLLEAHALEAVPYREMLEKMYEVLMHLIAPDGHLAKFGDTDVHADNEISDAMCLGAYLFERGDFKSLGDSRLPFSLLWRLGPTAVHLYEGLISTPPVRTSACFPIGGYLMSRQSWDRNAMYMAMRAGVGIHGHAHSDALSLILYANGREIVVDSGSGVYEWNKERKYMVSTRAHNTVVVDGQDQHVRSLHWIAPPTAACRIWNYRSEAQYDYFYASHYGYTRYDDPVIHSRKVLFVKNRYWLIVDLFEAREWHNYEQYYHLPSGEAIGDWDKRQFRTAEAGANVLIAYPPAAAEERLSLESGLLFRQGGYKPNPVVKRSMFAAGKLVMETLVVPFGESIPRLAMTRLPVQRNGSELPASEATALLIEGEEWRDQICLYHGNYRVTSYLNASGSTVDPALLPEPEPIGELLFDGKQYRDSVVVHVG